MKSYTDLEQSKKLAEILSLESADMGYMLLKKDGSKVSNVPFVKDGFGEPECCYIFIPCWSLAALLSVLPNTKLCHYDETYFGQYMGRGDEFPTYSTMEYNNSIDACYEMILKLNELNLL